jgi:hypothetical protein
MHVMTSLKHHLKYQLLSVTLLGLAGLGAQAMALDLSYNYTPIRIMPETSTVVSWVDNGNTYSETVYSPDWAALGITGYATNNTVLQIEEMRVSRDGWIAASVVADTGLTVTPVAVLLRNPSTKTWANLGVPTDTKWATAIAGGDDGDTSLELAPGGWVSMTAWGGPPAGRIHGPTGGWITPPVSGTDTWVSSVDLSSTTPRFLVASATWTTPVSNTVFSSNFYDPTTNTVTPLSFSYNNTTYPNGALADFKWDSYLHGVLIKTVDPDFTYNLFTATAGSATTTILPAFPAPPIVAGFTWPTTGEDAQWEGQVANSTGVIFDRESNDVTLPDDTIHVGAAAYLAHGATTPSLITPPNGHNSLYFGHGLDFSDGSFMCEWQTRSATSGYLGGGRGKWSATGGFVELDVPDYRSDGDYVGGDLNGTITARTWRDWRHGQQQTPFVLVKMPLVTLTVVTATATEGAGNAAVRFTRPNNGVDFPLTIRYAIGDTANLVPSSGSSTTYNGVSYYEATIPAGATTVDVALVAVNDAIIEVNNTVTVQLVDGLYKASSQYNSSDQTLVYNAGKYTYEYSTSGSSRSITVISDDIQSKPIPTLTRSGSGVTNSLVSLSVSFNEAVTGFDVSDITGYAPGSLSAFVANSSTSYSFTWTPPVSGTGSVSLIIAAAAATAVDDAANSLVSNTVTISYDTQAPTVSTPDLASGSDLGTSSTDNLTANNAPTFTGTSEAGATVSLFVDAVLKGTAVANSGGAWSITSNSTLTDGTHNVTASAQDAAGNSSAVSSALAITIDTVVAVAITTSPASTVTTGTPTWSGTCDTGATVAVTEGSTSLGAATSTGPGTWSFTPASALADGNHTLVFTATDAAGATASTTASPVLVDAVGPVVALAGSDLVGKAGESIALTATYSDAGSGVASISLADSTGVTVTPSGSASATVVVSGSGPATRTITLTGLTGDGTLVINVKTGTALDGNSLAASASNTVTVTVDSTVPADPTITLANASNSGSTADLLTNVVRPIVNGVTDSGTTVTIRDGSTVLGTATVTSTSWTFTPTADLVGQGLHTLTATATDAAGNASAATALGVTIDTQIMVTVNAASITTSSSSPTFSGTTDPNETVTITGVGFTTIIIPANGAGVWSVAGSGIAAGTYALTVTASDAAANSASTSLSLTIDQTAPTAPTTSASVVTNDTTPTLSGTAESGATITITQGSTVLGTATATGGNWTFTLTTPLIEGETILTITATDGVGNISTATTVTVTIDVTAPGLPTAVAPGTVTTATPTLTGTAEAGATVVIKEGATVLATVTANGSGAWTATLTTLANGLHTLAITAQDAAGNISVAAAATVTVNVPAGSSDDSDSSGNCGLGSGTSASLLLFISGLMFLRRRRKESV